MMATVLALASCGGDDADDPVAEPDPTESPTDEPADQPTDEPAEDASGGASITIADFAFDGVGEVTAGTTVVVTNEDGTTHTWTAADGSFDSGPIGAGESFEFTFDQPGEFSYFCSIHPSMTGSITVTG